MSNYYGCIICSDTFYPQSSSSESSSKERMPVALPGCGHTFHNDCIKRWFENGRTCPVCRAPANAVDIFPLQLTAARKSTTRLSRESFNPEEHPEVKRMSDEIHAMQSKVDQSQARLLKVQNYLREVRRNVRHGLVELEDNVPIIDLCDSPNVSMAAPSNAAASSSSSSAGPSNAPRASMPASRTGYLPNVPPLVRASSSSTIKFPPNKGPLRSQPSSSNLHRIARAAEAQSAAHQAEVQAAFAAFEKRIGKTKLGATRQNSATSSSTGATSSRPSSSASSVTVTRPGFRNY